MNTKIFRRVALERLSSPERLDRASRVTTPKAWLALAGIFFFLGAVVVWSFEGSLATKVTAQGVIIRRGGVINVVASGAGLIARLDVKIGDTVHADQVIAKIAQPALMERIRITEGALADARRERERALRVRTDSAHLQLDALARQRENAQREIVTLGEQIKIVEQQIQADEQLRSRGLITERQSLVGKEKKIALLGQVEALQAQIKMFDAQQFTTENQPKESDIDMQARITDLERNLASLEKDLSTTSNVMSPYAGQVLELKVYRGGAVSEGTPIASIQPDAGKLEGLVYLSAIEAKNVRPGMEAQISPGTVRREEYGYMNGKVSFVAAYPATPAAMMSTLENESLTHYIAAAGPVTEVRLELEPAATPSGFEWSSRQGPPSPISSGTLCSAQIVTEHEKPIALVLPFMKEKIGLN
jgi:HlyD family secretion protein